MLPLISRVFDLHHDSGASRFVFGFKMSLPPLIRMPVWNQYTIAAAILALLILILVLMTLSHASSKSDVDASVHRRGYTRLDADAESVLPATDDEQDGRQTHEVYDYPFELRKAMGTPVDQESFESRRLAIHITLAILAVVGLAIDAAAIASRVISGNEGESVEGELYLTSTSAALRMLIVVLSMLDLNLGEPTRMKYISLLGLSYLLAQLLVFLYDYKLFHAGTGADPNIILHAINVGSSLILFIMAFISPTGPFVVVEAGEIAKAQKVMRNDVGGGSVAQIVWGCLAFPVVRQAWKQQRIDETKLPALDYTFRSAVIAEEIISQYRASLSASLDRSPPGAARHNAAKGRALFSALIRCNASQLKQLAVILVVTTFSFYIPKLALAWLLNGMEDYLASIKDDPTQDRIAKRARSTMFFSILFYLSLVWEGFIVYYYFTPVTVLLKTKVQIQLTTLLAWKRLRQKEATAPTDATNTNTMAEQNGNISKDKHEGNAQVSEVSASSSSQVINLVTTDVNRIFDRLDTFGFGLMGPLEIFIGGYTAYLLLGNGALVGLLVAALLQPIVIYIGNLTEKFDQNLQEARDRRLMLLSEAIRAIRMVKYEAWEDEMAAKVLSERRTELKCQAQKWVVHVFFEFFCAFGPVLTIVVSFAWYTLVEGRTLTASVAFPAVAVLVELRFTVSHVPTCIMTVVQGWVSLKRIGAYLETGEVELAQTEYKPQLFAGAKDTIPAGTDTGSDLGRVTLRNAELTWVSDSDVSMSPAEPSSTRAEATSATSSSAFTLSISDASFEVGQTNLVCGKIGSGKTLLLLSLLGEARLVSGQVECPRSHPAATLYAARKAASITSHVHNAKWWIDLSLTAYAPQRPFLFNATVRDNILFGLQYHPQRYRSVIFACGLKPDLKIFPDGDRTEIGEGGTNLSGGQKARVSLARAIYSHAGTVLIDDCLSALDAHTTKHVCETLFDGGEAGLLAGRTTVLVTHHVRLMATRCRKVLVLQEGKQAFFGTSEQFINSIHYEGLEVEDAAAQGDEVEGQGEATPNFGSNSSTAAPTAANSDEEEDANDVDPPSLDAAHAEGGAHKDTKDSSAYSQRTAPALHARASSSAFSVSGIHDVLIDEGHSGAQGETFKQITEEKRAEGRVSLSVYRGYIRAGGGFLIWTALIGAFAASGLSDVAANWWLRLWAQSTSETTAGKHTTEWWLYRWIVIQLLRVFMLTAASALICTMSLLSGARLFKKLLSTVLQAPLRFHDSTPSGRLLNRFGKDMEAIDSELAEVLFEAANSLLMAVTCLFAAWLGVGPLIIVFLLVMSPLFYVLFSTFTVAARDLKRLDSNAASKRITCFTDLITGVVTIRAFGSSAASFATLMDRLDENMLVYFWQGSIRQWQSLLLGFVSSVFVLATVLKVTLTPGMSAATAGFTLGFVQNLTTMLQIGLRELSNVEQDFVAVERVMEYLEIENEPLDTAPAAVQGDEVTVGLRWPEKGAIEIRDLHLAYAEDLPDVLDGVTLSIQPGERVGIVGATGSGKSTLVSALFRFFEYRSGKVEIDGVDISRLGLKTLRSRIKIVPQDPLILSGTLRSAVDPLGQYSDQDITQTLVRVGLLKDKSPTGYGTFNSAHTTTTPNLSAEGSTTTSSTLLSRSPPTTTEESADESGTLSSLESRIEESGGNLSSGQKQLLSLSRILLSSCSPAEATRIVVLDESTSSIDYKTDDKIQTLLDSHFTANNTTVLAIAHRLRSIIHFDTVVVLNRGKVVEKGKPIELLKLPHGWFTRLAQSTGEQEYASLKRLAGL